MMSVHHVDPAHNRYGACFKPRTGCGACQRLAGLPHRGGTAPPSLTLSAVSRGSAPWPYLEGLLSTTGRKNAWQLAEVNGDATSHGIQHLLGGALWQADQLRDALYAYVVAH